MVFITIWHRQKRKYETYRILKATPYVNTQVVDLTKELVRAEQLGMDNDADLLALNFSCAGLYEPGFWGIC